MTDDLDRLIRDLGEVPRHSGRFIKAGLSKTAHGMKEGWQSIAQGHVRRGSLAAYPSSVTYDVEGTFPHFEAEIGPDHSRKQGRFGFVEDANGGVRSAPQKARPRLLKSGEKDFERGMDRAVEDALKRAGL